MINIEDACVNITFIDDQKVSYKRSKNKESMLQKIFEHISDTTELTIKEVKEILE
jgi:hypothetical protein